MVWILFQPHPVEQLCRRQVLAHHVLEGGIVADAVDVVRVDFERSQVHTLSFIGLVLERVHECPV